MAASVSRSHPVCARRVTLGVSGALTLAVGVYPEPFLRLVQSSLIR